MSKKSNPGLKTSARLLADLYLSDEPNRKILGELGALVEILQSYDPYVLLKLESIARSMESVAA